MLSLQLHNATFELTEAQPQWHLSTTLCKFHQHSHFTDYSGHHQSILPILEIYPKAHMEVFLMHKLLARPPEIRIEPRLMPVTC